MYDHWFWSWTQSRPSILYKFLLLVQVFISLHQVFALFLSYIYHIRPRSRWRSMALKVQVIGATLLLKILMLRSQKTSWTWLLQWLRLDIQPVGQFFTRISTLWFDPTSPDKDWGWAVNVWKRSMPISGWYSFMELNHAIMATFDFYCRTRF